MCQSESRAVAAAGITDSNGNLAKYATAFDSDKSYGCKCDSGYRGSDCSQSEWSVGGLEKRAPPLQQLGHGGSERCKITAQE